MSLNYHIGCIVLDCCVLESECGLVGVVSRLPADTWLVFYS